MLEPKDPSLNISPVPAEIDMEGDPGDMEIEWSDSGLVIEWEGGDSRIYTWIPRIQSISIWKSALMSAFRLSGKTGQSLPAERSTQAYKPRWTP
jgi:hypothetical protein